MSTLNRGLCYVLLSAYSNSIFILLLHLVSIPFHWVNSANLCLSVLDKVHLGVQWSLQTNRREPRQFHELPWRKWSWPQGRGGTLLTIHNQNIICFCHQMLDDFIELIFGVRYAHLPKKTTWFVLAASLLSCCSIRHRTLQSFPSES